MKKTAFFSVIITLLINITICFSNENVSPENTVVKAATFSCAENKTIQALFFENKAELTLSDGRHLLLLQAISASGARYTNTDESLVFWNKGNTAFIEEGNKSTFKDCITAVNNQVSAQLANPASVNCSKSGGDLVIEKRGDGGEYGVCTFQDNKACEEWALLRGDCPQGGVKTTGFDRIDQKYCVWLGGKTVAEPQSVCTFKDGSSCSTKAFYNGTCTVGH
jgi:putative hemolysin